MARFAFFCLSSSLGHVGRTVSLARALAARSHKIILVGSGFFLDPIVVPRGEFQIEPIWEPDLDVLLAPSRGGIVSIPEHELFDRALTDERELLAKLRPDVVVSDNRRTALVTAEVLGIPSLSLVNATMLGVHCALQPRLDLLAAICGPAAGISPEEMLAAPMYAGKSPSDPISLPAVKLSAAVDDVIEAHGGKRRVFLHRLCFGDRTLVLDPPHVMPTRDLPEGAMQIGPIFPNLDTPLPPWWDTLDPSKTIIYLTFGSTGIEGFEYAARQLIDSGTQCVMSTAHVADAARVPGIFAARYFPMWEILKRAQLVVCHGGTQTVYQALAAGTPVLTLPSHLETALTTVAIVQAGLGSTVPRNSIAQNPTLLTNCVETMLTDRALQSRVQDFAATIDSAASLAAAVKAAEELTS